MPLSEYMEWMEYHNRVPFPEEKVELLLSELLVMTANMNRNMDLHPEPFSPVDFMPWMQERELINLDQTQATTMQTKAELDRINYSALAFLNKLNKVH